MSEPNVDSNDEIQKVIKGILNNALGPYVQIGKNVFLKREEIRSVFCLGEINNDYEIRIEFVDGSVRKVTFIGGDIDKIKIN